MKYLLIPSLFYKGGNGGPERLTCPKDTQLVSSRAMTNNVTPGLCL